MKKDVKKSSYYVWFLGAHECKNVRDVDGALPAVAALADREKKVTPHKFTLQVSHRGLKIVHSVSAALSGPQPPSAAVGKGPANKSGDQQQLVKHLIPDDAVTCVRRDGDLVAVILLLYNPVTRWPVHVHAYRCDSAETAALLAAQLRALVDRPENRKKIDEIEQRLEQAYAAGRTAREPSAARRTAREDARSNSPPPTPPAPLLLPPPVPSQHHPEDAAGDPRVTALYDSLAAELKKKLGTGRGESGAPILLPPRDYDTVHRHRGNLNGIDFRRCMSANIVGVNGGAKPLQPPPTPQRVQQQEFRRTGGAKTQVHGSSGGSSGIGSDHPPSPEQYEPDNNAYADSSSDEDWNASPLEEPVFAKPSANGADHHAPLPRVRRQDSGVDSSGSPVHASPEKDYYYGRQVQEQQQHFGKRPANLPNMPNPRDKYSDRNVALVQPRPRKCDPGAVPAVQPAEFERKQPATTADVRRRTPSPASSPQETPRERFKDAKEKFLMLEKERMDEQRSALRKCAELRQRRDNGAVAAQRAQVIRAAVRGDRVDKVERADRADYDRGPPRAGYGSDDETTATDGDYDGDGYDRDGYDRDGYDRTGYDRDYVRDYGDGAEDDGFDGKRSRNVVRRSDRSRESLDDDRDYRGDGYAKPRRSRNVQPPEPPRPAASRSYSADEYAERRDRNRPSPQSADRYKSPQRRAADAPRVAPRRNHNGYGDRDVPTPSTSPPPLSSSRVNDYKRRSAAAYAYDDDCCGVGCPPPDRGGWRPRDAGSADDGLPPTMAGRDYKRRSAAAYAYDDRYRASPPPSPAHHPRPDHGRRDEPPAAASVSPRYRHSYAEPYHHGHRGRPHVQPQRSPSPVREPAPAYHRRHGGGGVPSLQPSGRIGIAAIHPY